MRKQFEATAESIAEGAPDIRFAFSGDLLRAELKGAVLEGVRMEGGSRLRLMDAEGELLADITLHERPHRTNTENVIDIGSALMWSHWRWLQAGGAR